MDQISILSVIVNGNVSIHHMTAEDFKTVHIQHFYGALTMKCVLLCSMEQISLKKS